MKKYFLLMAGFILLAFTACQNDGLENGGGGEVAVSFKVQVPDDGNSVDTRAGEQAVPGDGSLINRCILEIYLNDELYSRSIAKVNGKAATFDVRLVTSQTYDFVFWADNVADDSTDDKIKVDNHYKTSDGLKTITMQGYYNGSSKDDSRDAFLPAKQ